jgi:hypothetical protein
MAWVFDDFWRLWWLWCCSALAAGSTRSLSVRGGASLGVESQHPQFRGLRSVVVSGCGTLQRQCETNLAELSSRATCENATCPTCPTFCLHFVAFSLLLILLKVHGTSVVHNRNTKELWRNVLDSSREAPTWMMYILNTFKDNASYDSVVLHGAAWEGEREKC